MDCDLDPNFGLHAWQPRSVTPGCGVDWPAHRGLPAESSPKRTRPSRIRRKAIRQEERMQDTVRPHAALVPNATSSRRRSSDHRTPPLRQGVKSRLLPRAPRSVYILLDDAYRGLRLYVLHGHRLRKLRFDECRDHRLRWSYLGDIREQLEHDFRELERQCEFHRRHPRERARPVRPPARPPRPRTAPEPARRAPQTGRAAPAAERAEPAVGRPRVARTRVPRTATGERSPAARAMAPVPAPIPRRILSTAAPAICSVPARDLRQRRLRRHGRLRGVA